MTGFWIRLLKMKMNHVEMSLQTFVFLFFSVFQIYQIRRKDLGNISHVIYNVGNISLGRKSVLLKLKNLLSMVRRCLEGASGCTLLLIKIWSSKVFMLVAGRSNFRFLAISMMIFLITWFFLYILKVDIE